MRMPLWFHHYIFEWYFTWLMLLVYEYGVVNSSSVNISNLFPFNSVWKLPTFSNSYLYSTYYTIA